MHLKKNVKNSLGEKKVNDTPISLFETEYLFIFLFALLGAFTITTSVFEIMNKQTLAIFLGILAVAFIVVETIAMQSANYKKCKLINHYLRYYLSIFIIIGIVGGVIGGYFVSKLILKTDIVDFSYKKMLIVSGAISLVTLLSSVFTSKLANSIIKKIKKIQ